ncbi:MAG: carbonate dehydratase [Gammaproteobacteria bacterium]|nr:carbonate dehydratase [Gammaproteobacteria bacterium]
MKTLKHLFKRNIDWANSVEKENPGFFSKLSKQQTPEYLWIGCADSRVPANQIVDLAPGEIFVHRNIANLVVHTDLNCLSVIQYAVEVLRVKHIIVCGHYDCGGVAAALDDHEHGLIDNWLRHIEDVRNNYEEQLEGLDREEKVNTLCELNIKEQVKNVCRTSIVQSAWKSGQDLSVHGWIYNIENGILEDLGADFASDKYE